MPAQNDVVICEPLRTPIGRFGGALAGQRASALDAGLPDTVAGTQIDRRCGSGLQAVLDAAMQIRAGFSQVVIAGGVDVMSRAPFYSHEGRWGIRTPSLEFHDSLARGRVTAGGVNHPVPGGMIETAENLRREFAICRQDQDALAMQSQGRAAKAMASGLFEDEIVPITVSGRKGDTVVSTDEHPRPDTSYEELAALRPIMSRVDPQATVTAGNSSGQNDAAAACLVTSADSADRLGLTPLLRLVSFAKVGVPAATMGIGPVGASRAALERAGLTWASPKPTTSGSMSTGPASPSGIRWGRRVHESWRRWHAKCTVAAVAMHWKPCASAVVRALQRCSSASMPDATQIIF